MAKISKYYIRRARTIDECERNKRQCRECIYCDISLVPLEAKRYALSGSSAWKDNNGHVISKGDDSHNLMCVLNGQHTDRDMTCPLFQLDPERWIEHRN